MSGTAQAKHQCQCACGLLLTLDEPFREPSTEERIRYPYLGEYAPPVAASRCIGCEVSVLAIDWSSERNPPEMRR